MDKYTVDLDQVLNDFEYYELTDQHSKNVLEKTQNNIQYQPPPATAKHSINNVFHSLNEYLNSSVGVNNEVPSSSFLQANNKSESDINKPVCNTSDVVRQEVKSSTDKDFCDKENKAKNGELVGGNFENETLKIQTETADVCEDVNIKNECDSSVIEQTDSLLEQGEKPIFIETCIENGENAELGIDINKEPVLIDIASDEASDIAGVAESYKNEYLPNDNVQQNMQDFIIEPSGSWVQNGNIGNIEGNIIDDEETVVLKKAEAVAEKELLENQKGNYETSNKICIEDFVEDKDNFNNAEPNFCSSELKQDPSPKLDVPNCEETYDNNQQIFDNPADDHEETVKPTKVQTSTKENDSSDKLDLEQENHTGPPKPVTFYVENIDLDESELHKMLEDLELEEEEISGNEVQPKEGVDGVDVPEQDKSYGDNIEGAQDEGTVEVNQIGHLEDYKSDNIVESEPDPATKPIKPFEPKIIECLEVEKPKKLKYKENVSPETENQEAEPVAIAKQEETSKDLVKHGEVSKEEEPNFNQILETTQNLVEGPSECQSEEAQSRPDTLPLNNEIKGDEKSARKINLIGSPGSTPYNNVYVNKSIKKPKTQETESTNTDYTGCSASPTFSDCSTESTSTASTVSVEDDPNNSERFVKTTPKVKNVNIENEVAKLQGAGGGQHKKENPKGSGSTVSQEEAVTEASGENVGEEASNNPQSNQKDTSWVGKEAPLWIPDADASSCLHCDMKFTLVKRRHHCRACGLVLCSKCCNLKRWLEYLEAEARVCNKCYEILCKDTPNNALAASNSNSPETGNSPFRPNPNNPLEYCSTVSPLQQAGQAAGENPPSVMVPVGVLKRKGSNKKSNKSVMFCDGIAPGSDLTNLDQDFNYNKPPGETKKVVEKAEPTPPAVESPVLKNTRNQNKIDKETGCYIPKCETSLPPTITRNKTDTSYSDCSNSLNVVEMLKNEKLTFAITQNLFVYVKIINMNCCINKQAWCFTSDGLINVGSDEVMYLIEYIEEESFVPKDVFFHIYNVYLDAVKGISIKELGLSLHDKPNFLDSRNHAGFVYIKPSFQCLENVIVPKEPYLVGILIHRWETPWAKLFPLRLILRLGAEYRYYPSPLISTRHRDSVFVEIGHTIINLLADFRNFSYTLPQIRGLIIHMEDKKTTITIPKNRYDQVIKSISNSSEHILAFAGNFSAVADSHLVCIQDTQGHENSYATHAINIHNKPRKVTGACFIVFNGSLKSDSGLTAKSNIVEDGLMIQVPSEHMDKLRENLRLMKTHTIACGCINAESDETVNIIWGENDTDFNNGVKSPVDNSDMKGIPSIRVHNGKDYASNNGARLIRWTEVFIIQSGEENSKNQDPIDISKVSESIAKACCTALVKYLDLLVTNNCNKIGIRTTLHVENVSYSAGSNGTKLTPIYMRSLDNELIPILHRITSNNLGDNAVVLELIFRILNA